MHAAKVNLLSPYRTCINGEEIHRICELICEPVPVVCGRETCLTCERSRDRSPAPAKSRIFRSFSKRFPAQEFLLYYNPGGVRFTITLWKIQLYLLEIQKTSPVCCLSLKALLRFHWTSSKHSCMRECPAKLKNMRDANRIGHYGRTGYAFKSVHRD